MKKAIVFDFGHVISNFEPDVFVHKFNPQTISHEQFKQVVFSNWEALDAGEMDIEEHLDYCFRHTPIVSHKEIQDFFNAWPGYFVYNRPIYNLIKELETRDVRLLLLSNAPSFFETILEQFEILQSFEGYVISGVEKVMKPDPRIYQILLERFDLNPQSTLFIDDLLVNVEAARQLGITAVQYTGDTQAVYEWLERNVG